MTNKAKLWCGIAGVFLVVGCSSPPAVVLEVPTLLNPVCIGPTAHLKSGGAPENNREVGTFADSSDRVRKRLTIYLPNPNGNSDGIAVFDENRRSSFLEESVLEKTAGKHDLSIRDLTFKIRSKDFFLFMPGLLINAFFEYSKEQALSGGRLVGTSLKRLSRPGASENQSQPATQEGSDAHN